VPGLNNKADDSVVPPAFVTYRKSATGFRAADDDRNGGDQNGDPGTACRTPLLVLIEYAEIVPAPVHRIEIFTGTVHTTERG